MRFINKYLRNLSPYKVASHKVWEVNSDERSKILKLDWNEATIPPSPKVKERILQIIQDDSIYPLYPSTHNPEIIELLAGYLEVEKKNIQYFASSDSAHEYLGRVFVAPGDPVLVLGPTYDNFRLSCQTQGAQVYFQEYEAGFYWNRERFEQKIEEVNPSLIYICNPNNPSGTMVPTEDLTSMLSKYPDVVFLVDEAYAEFSGVSIVSSVNQYNNLVVSRTFSKAFAMANFRAGYLVSCGENIMQISKIRNPKNVTTVTQEAVIGALMDIPYMNHYVTEVRQARTIFTESIQKLDFVKKVYESQGNFVLVEFLSPEIKNTICEYLAGNQIFVRNLTHSKMLENTLRITIGTQSQMLHVIKILEKFSGSGR
jgi:histidinol-phosphate aminotransferase